MVPLKQEPRSIQDITAELIERVKEAADVHRALEATPAGRPGVPGPDAFSASVSEEEIDALRAQLILFPDYEDFLRVYVPALSWISQCGCRWDLDGADICAHPWLSDVYGEALASVPFGIASNAGDEPIYWTDRRGAIHCWRHDDPAEELPTVEDVATADEADFREFLVESASLVEAWLTPFRSVRRNQLPSGEAAAASRRFGSHTRDWEMLKAYATTLGHTSLLGDMERLDGTAKANREGRMMGRMMGLGCLLVGFALIALAARVCHWM